MKLFLAGERTVKNEYSNGVYILESYYYCKKNKHFPTMLKASKEFLLDSGAYTYMSGGGAKVNFEKYVCELAEFINHYKINLFFEMDIDQLVGIKEVERLRTILETRTGKQCIPVWHKSRGLDYFKKMVADYKYIAIGGIVTKEIKGSEHPIFTNLINLAHSKGCKIHGLGYTNLKGLAKYHWDTVDSTTWLYGNKSGKIFKFDGTTIKIIDKPKGTRLHSKAAEINNFNEWVKFQQYAEHNL